MKFLGGRLVFLVLSAARLSSCGQQVGDSCILLDGNRGTCLDIGDCFGKDGRIEKAGSLRRCEDSSSTRVIVCCRKSPKIIIWEKCIEWRRLPTGDGSHCRHDLPPKKRSTVADVGEYPHLVSILKLKNGGMAVHVCGGALISDRYVLTAAHCQQGDETLYARLGAHDLTRRVAGAIDSEVIDFIQHPEYQQSRRVNDIALLKLLIPVPFSREVRPACLPYPGPYPFSGMQFIVAGWGAYDSEGQRSNEVRKTAVRVIDRSRCVSNPVIPNAVNIICAEEAKPGDCTGDDGGPLMMVTPASTCEAKEVVGLVSRGVDECKEANVPGTYTRIEYYLNWIVSVVWSDEL